MNAVRTKKRLENIMAQMKYIKTKDENGVFEIFVFTPSTNHDAFMEGVSRMRDKTNGNWKRVTRVAVSAGFVGPGVFCHGNSESLGLSSMPEDTDLLRKQMGMV